MRSPCRIIRHSLALIALVAAPITLYAQPSDPPDKYEPNDSMPTARSIHTARVADDSVRRSFQMLTLHDTNDVDYYSIALPTGAHYDLTISIRDVGNAAHLGRTADVGVSAYIAAEGTWSPVYDNNALTIEDDPGNTTVIVKVQPIVDGSTGTYDLVLDIVSRLPASAVPLETASTISVAPNPASSMLSVSTTDDAMISRCELVDIRGRVVAAIDRAGPERSVTIDLDGIEAGCYFARIFTSSGIDVRRVVVAR